MPDSAFSLTLDNRTAQALAAVLGRVIDNTESDAGHGDDGPLDSLYNALVDAGFDGNGYRLVTQTNDAYRPDDDEDTPHFIRLTTT